MSQKLEIYPETYIDDCELRRRLPGRPTTLRRVCIQQESLFHRNISRSMLSEYEYNPTFSFNSQLVPGADERLDRIHDVQGMLVLAQRG